MRNKLSIFLALLLTSCAQHGEYDRLKEKEVSIYYIPFSLETYTPVGKTEIENLAIRTGSVSEENLRLKEIVNLINNSKHSIKKPFNIRVKIVLSETRIIYIGKDGTSELNNTEGRSIDDKNLVNIEKLIEGITN